MPFDTEMQERVFEWIAKFEFAEDLKKIAFEFDLGNRKYLLHFTNDAFFQERIDDGSGFTRNVWLYTTVKPRDVPHVLKEAGCKS